MPTPPFYYELLNPAASSSAAFASIKPITSTPRPLSKQELDGLWEIVTAINKLWSLFPSGAARTQTSNLNQVWSSWKEFVTLRTESGTGACYVGEYENALKVTEYLKQVPGEDDIQTLLLANASVLLTRLGHAKHFVVDEFISVLVVLGAFRNFGGENYNGYIAGSRFNRVTPICQPVELPAWIKEP